MVYIQLKILERKCKIWVEGISLKVWDNRQGWKLIILC